MDDFAERFVGRSVYMVADLFAGYDGRLLHENSRDLTSFGSIIGPHRLTSLPQGFCNSMPEFQRCSTHALRPEIPEHADVFIDDTGIMGPRSTYDNETLPDNPNIRRFVYEFATTVDRVFARFIGAGVTASGTKLILATPMVHIVGSVVSMQGWHLEHGIVNKILKWHNPLNNVHEVRQFLGTAGVGRRWIKNFSLIAKPLTLLTRSSTEPFYFDSDASDAMERLKILISEAPVLKVIDYSLAKEITQFPREDDHGLVVLAVDSWIGGAGWVLFQVLHIDKFPILYGSCTYGEAETRYSQPKAELYGVFRAFKELRHRIWGIHFRLEVDAKFLKEMINSPDLPNAPMTRWICYLQLFDFELKHVPAEKHKGPDGLSRRPSNPDDSDEDDAEGYLDRVFNMVSVYSAQNRRFPSMFTDFRSPTKLDFISYPTDSQSTTIEDFLTDAGRDWYTIGSLSYESAGKRNSLFESSLLRSTTDFTLVDRDFTHRKVSRTTTDTFLLGDECIDLEFTEYAPAYMSRALHEEPNATDRSHYDTVTTPDSPQYISCIACGRTGGLLENLEFSPVLSIYH